MVDLPQQSRTDSPLSIEADYTPFINFAMQQNAVPLIRALSVTNHSDKQTTGVTVRVWSDPPVVTEEILRVDAIDSGSKYTFSAPSLTLQFSSLRKQSER